MAPNRNTPPVALREFYRYDPYILTYWAYIIMYVVYIKNGNDIISSRWHPCRISNGVFITSVLK
ncbi:hypothetical protein OG21DRAFT_145575 [Imleria badia]|nr:hypothetical protein OG21DRAFT_145575 [Imleria badia]